MALFDSTPSSGPRPGERAAKQEEGSIATPHDAKGAGTVSCLRRIVGQRQVTASRLVGIVHCDLLAECRRGRKLETVAQQHEAHCLPHVQQPEPGQRTQIRLDSSTRGHYLAPELSRANME